MFDWKFCDVVFMEYKNNMFFNDRKYAHDSFKFNYDTIHQFSMVKIVRIFDLI